MIAGTAAAVLAAIAVLGYYRERSPGEAAQPSAAGSEEKAMKRPSKAISKTGDRVPSRPEGCTEAVAALGLCALKPAQKKEAITTPAPQATVTRSKGIDAGKADGKEPPRTQTCTDATAALGLCTPKPPQRKE